MPLRSLRGLLGAGLLAAILVPVACKSASTACVPGASVACTGPAGCLGGQVCAADGDSYSACVCGGDSGVADASRDAPHSTQDATTGVPPRDATLDQRTPDAAGADATEHDATAPDARGTDAHIADASGRDAMPAVDAGTVDSASADAPPANPCATSGLVTLAAEQYIPRGIAVDSNSAYWSVSGPSAGEGGVLKVPICGGDVVTLASGQTGNTSAAPVVNATGVYWGNIPIPFTADTAAILRVGLDGGIPVTVSSGFGQPRSLHLTPTSIFWLDVDSVSLLRAPLAGGSATTLTATPGADEISVYANDVYWTSNPSGPYAVDAMRVSVDGGVSSTLATFTEQVDGGSSIAGPSVAIAEGLYWVPQSNPFSATEGIVVRTALDGGAITTVASGFAAVPTSPITSDGINVYWASAGDDAILKVSVHGGTPVTVVTFGPGFGLPGQTQPTGIAVDDASVYWTVSDNEAFAMGSVYKFTPK